MTVPAGETLTVHGAVTLNAGGLSEGSLVVHTPTRSVGTSILSIHGAFWII